MSDYIPIIAQDTTDESPELQTADETILPAIDEESERWMLENPDTIDERPESPKAGKKTLSSHVVEPCESMLQKSNDSTIDRFKIGKTLSSSQDQNEVYPSPTRKMLKRSHTEISQECDAAPATKKLKADTAIEATKARQDLVVLKRQVRITEKHLDILKTRLYDLAEEVEESTDSLAYHEEETRRLQRSQRHINELCAILLADETRRAHAARISHQQREAAIVRRERAVAAREKAVDKAEAEAEAARRNTGPKDKGNTRECLDIFAIPPRSGRS
ncbi:hypothetical protein EDC01DRAFT_630711 [Geopyxis carbonaria]|nr:hypothetical protein EDC01DRAFT_630711 [Geopyxis carbonaria]